MWAKLRASNLRTVLWYPNESELVMETGKSLNINEEYLNALRTNSFADFFNKSQKLASNKPKYPSSYVLPNHHETLLKPCQESVSNVLESAIMSKIPELKTLMLKFFDTSAEASEICGHILNSISQIHYNYQFIQKAVDTINTFSSSDNAKLVIPELTSFIVQENPFSDLKKLDFKLMHEEYRTVLHHLKSKKRKVNNKIKLIQFISKASGICMTAACTSVTVIALLVLAHTFAGIIVGPLVFILPVKKVKNKLLRCFQCYKRGYLKRIKGQLDVAAKGMYILNRNFDTMSRLVARLHDEIEHNKTMVQFCLKSIEDKLSFELMNELQRTSIREKVEELEEHVCLCLVTINRARSMVIKELSQSCIERL